MKGWEFKNLEEICSIKGGKRLPKGHDLTNIKTSHPYIRARDIGEGKITFDQPQYITNDTFRFINKYIVNEGDIVITIVGANIGDIGYISNEFDKANLTENAVKLTAKKELLFSKFLKYALLPDGIKKYFQVIASGAAQGKLGLYKIKGIKIFLPPLSTQYRIGSILSAYDDLIENNLNRINLLYEIGKIQFDNFKKTCNLNGESELKNIATYLGRGVTPIYEEGSGFFAINQKANKGLFIEEQHLKEYKTGDWIPFDRYAKNGDVLINCLGEGTIGRCHFYKWEDNVYPIDQHMSIFRGKSKAISLYVYQFLDSEEGQGVLYSLKKGGTNMTMLNISDLRCVKIKLPEVEKLNEYYLSVEPLFAQKAIFETQNRLLKASRDILLPLLLSGKIEVKGLVEEELSIAAESEVLYKSK